MKRPLLAAVLAACYGILAVAATAPHAHDSRPSPPSHEAVRSLDALPAVLGEPDNADHPASHARPNQCRLCAWGRSMARPASATQLHEIEPPPVSVRRTPDVVRPDLTLVLTPLLRAPPAA